MHDRRGVWITRAQRTPHAGTGTGAVPAGATGRRRRRRTPGRAVSAGGAVLDPAAPRGRRTRRPAAAAPAGPGLRRLHHGRRPSAGEATESPWSWATSACRRPPRWPPPPRCSTPDGPRGPHRPAWLLFAFSSAMTSLGNGIWGWYEVVLRRPVPQTSAADFCFLMFAPPAIIGLLVLAKRPVTRAGWVCLALDTWLIGGSLLTLSWSLALARTADLRRPEHRADGAVAGLSAAGHRAGEHGAGPALPPLRGEPRGGQHRDRRPGADRAVRRAVHLPAAAGALPLGAGARRGLVRRQPADGVRPLGRLPAAPAAPARRRRRRHPPGRHLADRPDAVPGRGRLHPRHPLQRHHRPEGATAWCCSPAAPW